MSVNIEIKPLDENQLLMTVPDIAKLMNLDYGYSDNNYCLVYDKTGQYTILYDENQIGRGFEIWYENNSICLRLPLPTTGHDIDIFYQLVEKICTKMGVYFYQCEGETVAITDIYANVDNDKESSMAAIRHIADTVSSGKHKYMILFGAVNPVFIGESEIKEIGNDIEGFDKFMDRIQKTNAYYLNPRFYNMADGKLRGFYFLRDNTRYIAPLTAEYPYQKIDNLHCYLVQLPDDNYIPYDVFISNIRYAEYYDANHILFSLNENDIEEFVDKYAVDMITSEPVKGFYWGKIIDADYTHSNKIQKFNLPLDKICGLNHIAIFLRWANENKLLSDELLERCPQLSEENPDYRKIMTESYAIRGMLRSKHFNEKGKDFVNKFYRFNAGGYPSCVDKWAEKFLGTEKYNCEEYHDEAYLFVPYDEYCYKNLSAYIDREWKKYNK